MTDTTPVPTEEDLDHVLQRSLELLHSLKSVLEDCEFDDSVRPFHVLATCDLAIEHGVSICVLVESGNLASANVLLRTQFEAVARALWMSICAEIDWFEIYSEQTRAAPLKLPKCLPAVDKALMQLNQQASHIAGQLLAIKAAAWDALNSFVHSGAVPAAMQQRGYMPNEAIGTVCNANGLTTMAFANMAMLAQDAARMKRLSELQLEFHDCLPPLIPYAARTAPEP
jgi:hypothetical protein